jgi:hypothetical protein
MNYDNDTIDPFTGAIMSIPTIRPGIGVVIIPGSKSSAIQSAISIANQKDLPLYIDPGTYNIDQTLTLPFGFHLKSDGAIFVGTTTNPIIAVTESNIVDGFIFKGAVDNVTAISGQYIRTELKNLQFWTSVSNCIIGNGLLSRIEKCGFGLFGPITSKHEHIKIRSPDSATNFWAIRDCDFYNATGEASVEIGDGFMLELSGCDFELNQTRVPVKIAGMYSVNIHDNWFEHNAGQSQVELLHDATNTIGNYVVSSHNNWWNLNGTSNLYAYDTSAGAVHINFYDESGTSWNGKRIASDTSNVASGHYWLVGI